VCKRISSGQALDAVIAADKAFLEPLSQRQRASLASLLKRLLLPAELAVPQRPA